MRILSLFATVVTVVLMVHSACAQGSLLPERDYLSEPARRPRYSEESEEVADEIGQASGTELESLDVQGLSESSVLAGAPPDGDADPLALKPDPRVSKLEDRFEKLSKKFEASTAKKVTYPNFKITGFTQFDTGYYSQTDKNRSIVGDAQDGTGFRRVRLAVQGKAAELTNYQLEVDFATAGRPSFFDTYVEQESLPYLGDVRVGHFLQPFSVDALSGFRNLPFLERSLPFLAFVPFRRDGIMSHNISEDERTIWAYSLFRTGGFNNAPLGDSRFGTDFGDIGGYSFSARIAHQLYNEENGKCFWQIGGSYDYSQLGANDAVGSGTTGNAGSPRPFYQARTSPEFGPLGYSENSNSFGSAVNGTPSFVDTGRYEASHFQIFGIETLYQNGPFSMQAEWMGTAVESVVGQVFYNGAYAEVMYRLTGEHREFDKKLGALKNPVPFQDFISLSRGPDAGIRGWGAWEIAYRWSFVDLTNPSSLNGHYYNSATNTFTGSNHAGNGTLNDSTLGISWFLNANTKIQANWICALLDNEAKGFSTANLFVGRVQVAF
jgi:phosphate-selective porin OprO/OprP